MPVTLAQRVLAHLRQQQLFSAGQRVGVAVSGGADSIALLLLLLQLRDELGLVLSVVHLNHQLRGRASDADEKFVAKLAAKHHLDLHLERLDVAAEAKREKANLEDAARRARYTFFSRLIAENKLDRVATAHTADDQAETVLAHILRGTGLAGLGGIHPETNSVIRPLLHIRRAELRSYLRSKKQAWREDATNQDTTRTRARIRKKLLPSLERQFQPAIVGHLVSLAELARDDEALLDMLTRQRCRALAKQSGGVTRITISDLLDPMRATSLNTDRLEGPEKIREQQPPRALTKRLLRRLIEETKHERNTQAPRPSRTAGSQNPIPRSAEIAAQHIAAVLDLARRGENGKALQLPGGVEVRRERNDLLFCNCEPRASSATSGSVPGFSKGEPRRSEAQTNYEHQIVFQNATKTLQVAAAGCVFRFRVIDWPPNRVDTRESGTVLDRDRLRFPLVLRNWRPGDRIQPTGHQKPHKLKRLFNEKRISRWDRVGWPVLTSGDALVWARGFPVAAGFAATRQTRVALLIAESSASELR